MSKEKGHSEEKTDNWGRKYTQHYDEDGKESGRSEEKTDNWGRKYAQHYDEDGKESGRSEEETDNWGRKYAQHYDEDGKESGRSEKKTDNWGHRYTQHYDDDGKESGRSEKKTDNWGKKYTQEYDGPSSSRPRFSPSRNSRSASSSSESGSTSLSDSSRPYEYAESSSESSSGYGAGSGGESNDGMGWVPWVLIAIALVVFFASNPNGGNVQPVQPVQPVQSSYQPPYDGSQNRQQATPRDDAVMSLRGTWPAGSAPTRIIAIPDPSNPTSDTMDVPLYRGDDLELIFEPLWVIDFKTIGLTIEIAVDEGDGFKSLNQLQSDHDLIPLEQGRSWLLKRRIMRFHRTTESNAMVAPLRFGFRKLTVAEALTRHPRH